MDKKWRLGKGSIAALAIGGAAAVATAIALPLVLTSKEDDNQTQVPITGRYYSLLGDNNRFDTLDQAKAYLNTLLTIPQVYKYNNIEYSTLLEMQQAVELIKQNALGTNTFDPKIYQTKSGTSGAPANGTSLVDYTEITTSTGNVGYEFGGKLYTTLVGAQTAWLNSLPAGTKKVNEVAEAFGQATVNITNLAYPGLFDIALQDANDKNVSEILSKLSWVRDANDLVIPADQSLSTIAFADAGTDAYIIDPANSSNHLQSFSFLSDYSTTPIDTASMTITPISSYVPAKIATPLTTTVFIQDQPGYSFPGYEYQFTKITKFVNLTFPHMNGSTFVRGDASRADIATWWDDMIKTLGVTAVVAEPDRDWITIYKGAETFDVDMSQLPPAVTLPTGWKTVNYMENINDTSLSKQSKEALVLAMIYQGLVRVDAQATNISSPAVPATYQLYISPGANTESVLLNVVGSTDGTELSLDSFTRSIFGGKPEETYAKYTLNYGSTETSIKVLGDLIIDGQTPNAPLLPTAEDMTVQVNSDYVAYVAPVDYTLADAPAIPTETYNESIEDGDLLSLKTIFTGSFHGYIFDGKFYDTLFAAQQAFMEDYFANNPALRPDYTLGDTATSKVIVKGIVYDSLVEAQNALIYFVDWIGSPDALSGNPSRTIDDIYGL